MVKGIRSKNSQESMSSNSTKNASNENAKILTILLDAFHNSKKSSKKKVNAEQGVFTSQIEYTLFAEPLSHGRLTNYSKKFGKLSKNRVKPS